MNTFNEFTPVIAAYWAGRISKASRAPVPVGVQQILECSSYSSDRDAARPKRGDRLRDYVAANNLKKI